MSTSGRNVFHAVSGFLEDVIAELFPPSVLRHPIQVEKAVLRAIDRNGVIAFCNETYVCNVVIILMNPEDLDYSKMFPKTFRGELLKSIQRHIDSEYGSAKNKDDEIDLKIIEDPEVRRGIVDVEVSFDESKSRTGE